MKNKARTKEDLLKELNLLQRKTNRLEKNNKKLSDSQKREKLWGEAIYNSIFKQSLDGVFVTSPAGKIIDINERGLIMLGYNTIEEMYNMDLFTELYSNAADKQRILTWINSQGSAEFEVDYKKKNGELIITQSTLAAVKDRSGKITSYTGIFRDISGLQQSETTLRQLNRKLRALSDCNQTLLRAVEEQSILNEICRIICDEAGYRMAWVGYVEHDEAKSVRTAAWSGSDSSGFVANAKLSWNEDSESGQDLAGKTIRSGEINYIQDILSEPKLSIWLESALQYGYRSIITLPLKDENSRVFGVLLIYSSEPNTINPDEIRLLEELSSDLAFGINTLRVRAEHKRMEEEVKQSEERFRMVFENVLDGISLCAEDPDPFKRKIIECNERYAIMAGRSREELLRLENLEGLITYDDTANKNRLESLDVGKSFQGSFSWNRPDGKENVIEYVGRPVTWRGKNYTIGIDRDITERVKLEAKVRQSEEKFRLVFENAFDGISIYSEDPDPFKRKLVDCNERYAAMAGRSREELLNCESPQKFMVPLEDGSNISRLDSLEKETAFRGYSSWIRPDGKENVIEYVGMPVKWQGKAFTIGIDRDITERKRAENELRKLSRAVEQSPVSIVITGTNGNIEYINPKASETSGYHFEEAVGRNPRIFSSHEKSKSDYKVLWDTIISGKEWRGELHNKKKNGVLYWESASISPILNEKGEVTHFIAIKEDITERKLILEELIVAKEKAEQSDKLKSEFLSQVSHEIRTPLVAIVSFTDLIREDIKENNVDYLPEYLKSLSNVGKRLQRTFDLIGNAAQILTKNYEPDFSKINLVQDILLNISKEFEDQAKLKGLDYIFVDNSKDQNIIADEYSLNQLFSNLFDNAIKYTNEGFVKIEINQENEAIFVKVIDSGIGISEEFLSYLFQLFRQEEQGYSRKYEGNGLGLMLSMKYCEINNGEISVESVKGKGSTFTVKFKLHFN